MEQLLPPRLVEKARQVIEKNRAAGRRIAVAESCTGGLVSAALTEIPGASGRSTRLMRGAKTLLLAGMILLPGCLVITCGSSDLEQQDAAPEATEGTGGDF